MRSPSVALLLCAVACAKPPPHDMPGPRGAPRRGAHDALQVELGLGLESYREVVPRVLADDAPASVYARLDPDGCEAEVERRSLPVVRVESTQRGVLSGMRIAGAMNGVEIVTPTSKFGVLDCRLALAVDDFTKALREAGVVRLSIDNIYRPGAKLPGRHKSSQHAHGLALDITAFGLADGRVLSTSRWGAGIGEVPCGPDASMRSPSAETVALRNLVCSIARRGFFHTLLTPTYDAAHQFHFHFDLKPDTSRVSVR